MPHSATIVERINYLDIEVLKGGNHFYLKISKGVNDFHFPVKFFSVATAVGGNGGRHPKGCGGQKSQKGYENYLFHGDGFFFIDSKNRAKMVIN
jgi:hypothetical protein